MKHRLSLLSFALGFAFATPAMSEEITVSCGIGDVQIAMCKRDGEAWSKETGNTVKVVEGPAAQVICWESIKHFFQHNLAI